MHQVAATYWNQIAEQQTLATEWAQQMFPLSESQLDKALAKEEARIHKETGDWTVTNAYLQMMPLLWEREAISRFTAQNPNMRHVLPEVMDASEAVMIAAKDRPMNESQMKKLWTMLKERPT